MGLHNPWKGRGKLDVHKNNFWTGCALNRKVGIKAYILITFYKMNKELVQPSYFCWHQQFLHTYNINFSKNQHKSSKSFVDNDFKFGLLHGKNKYLLYKKFSSLYVLLIKRLAPNEMNTYYIILMMQRQ